MNNYAKIYVLCPANNITGGPDALHQMVFYLRQLGLDAIMVYDNSVIPDTQIQIPIPYRNYLDSFSLEKDIVDADESIIIIPENLSHRCQKYRRAKVIIWWLSVNNNKKHTDYLWKIFFLFTLPLRIAKNKKLYNGTLKERIKGTLYKMEYSFDNEANNITHFCASYYAYDYISKKSKREVILCIEPISKKFLDEYWKLKESTHDSNKRNNTIIFNPKKSQKIVDELLKYDSTMRFKPLTGMNQDELIQQYMKSKLYIDFGSFPGAERMPKEAVLFGCTIITGKHGASAFYGDVPILDEYKFDEKVDTISTIKAKIDRVLSNYETEYQNFNNYRDTVLQLESKFIDTLKDYFIISD